MANNANATLTVRLRDLASSGFRTLGNSARSAVQDIQKSGERARKAFDIAGTMSLAASGLQQFKTQLDSVTTGPIEDFKDFEFQMARVQQLSGDLAKGEFEQLRQKAIDLGESTFFTGMEAAQGLEQLAIAGFDAQQQLEAIQPVLRLTQAAGTDLGLTADIASDLIGAFGLKASDTARVADVLTATFTNSTTTLEDLYEAFKLSGPIATQAGISMEKLSVLTGLLGNAGLKGSAGGTALRGALLGLTTPSKGAAKGLRKVGLDASFIEKNLSDPLVIIQQLSDRMQDMSEAERLNILGTIFGRRQAGAVGVLVDALKEGNQGLEKLQTAVANSEGRAESFGRAMEETAKGKVKLLESQIAKLRLELGENMLPVQQQFMEITRDVVKGLSDFAKENPRATAGLSKLAVGFGGALAVVVPLTFGLQSLITLVGILGPVFTTASWPIRAGAKALSQYTTQAWAANTATGKLKGAVSGGVGVIGAALAGWEIGTILDSWIGKVFDLKEGLLSIEIADQLGQRESFNSAMEGLGTGLQAVGLESAGTALQDAAAGNREVSRKRFAADFDQSTRDTEAGLQAKIKEAAVKYSEFNPNSPNFGKGGKSQVDINLDVSGSTPKVTGVRTRDTKGGPALNVGQVNQTP